MKMTYAHFDGLKAALQPLRGSIPARQEAIRLDSRVKDVGMRLRWDLLWAAKVPRTTWDEWYQYLNDSHIDSALRKIV